MKKSHLRELAMEMSLLSLGSSHTFPFPHFITEAASRFWGFSETIFLLLPFWRLVLGGEELNVEENGFLYMTFSRVTTLPPKKKKLINYNWASC